MKRLYQHRGHAIDVSVEAQCPAYPTQNNPAATPDYIAILTIYPDESDAMPMLGPLRVDRTTERAFASEAEALMGGFSEGRRLVDRQIESDESALQDAT
ncbi:hypothetical protein [Paraburkholderia bannensis]|uniref:hypothetical protein n=1 Tax=Paraburkholderia bannensis TaxID=765414 RepID=UPI002AB64557|nr:hypothetical protein [Paraburkholderia bannensis]